MPLISPRQWLRRLVFWIGALLVAVVAIGFASAADAAGQLFLHIVQPRPWIVFILAPAGLALSVLLTRKVFPGAQGSGIPQVIAALHMTDLGMINRVLSLRIAVGKIILTLLGLACGASIGREGPTVQVSAAIMHAFGQRLRLPRLDLQRALVLAGGAAGISAAFNTPLAGVVFAIEELSHSFEARTSGTVFTAVIIGGATTMALAGNYTYFGHTSAELQIGHGWIAVVLCSVLGGVLGGLFSLALVRAAARTAGPRRSVRDAPACAVRGALRSGAGGARHGVRRHDLRHRLRPGAQRGGRRGHAADGVSAAQAGGDRRVLCQRHSRRHFRAVAGDRRGHRILGVLPAADRRRPAPSCCWGWRRISPAWCRRRSPPR